MQPRPLQHPTSQRRERGVSLIEILIGVTIGVIGILAIFQTVAVWNKHTQTTTSGGDAQIAGTLAMFNLERDLKQAGQGFNRAPLQVMGCPVTGVDLNPARPLPLPSPFPLQPVTITVGPGGAPDTIQILYGNSSYFVDQQTFTASPTTSSKTLTRRGGFHPGDLAVIAANWNALPGSAQCELIEITGDINVDGRTVNHDSAPYNSFYAGPGTPARFNPAGGANPAFVAGNIYNLGPQPQLSVWTVGNPIPLGPQRSLMRTEQFGPTPPLQIADGVVNMKAQYGIDVDNDCQISNVEWTNAPPVGTDLTQLLAVRIALLVRGRQFERSGDPSGAGAAPVTPNRPAWAGGLFTMTNVDGTPDAGPGPPNPNNWRYYRYRVYERVIPLRNMIWGKCP
jgi:type IV pilus assembly protein PilW